MASPLLVQLHIEGLAFGGDVDLLPPQRAIAGFDHQVAIAGSWRGYRDLGSSAISVSRLVQRQLDLVGAHCAAFGIVLGAIPRPEAFAGHQASLWVFHLDAVRPPLDLEGQLGSRARLYVDALLALSEEFFVVVVAPAVALRVVPVVIAALSDQPYLEVACSELVAVSVGHQELEFHRAVAVGFLALEHATQARQAVGGPDRLFETTGDRSATGLLQAGLHGQLQRRARFGPAAFDIDHGLASLIEGHFIQLQVLVQLGFGDRTKLITRQSRYRFAQGAQVRLAAQAIARRRRTVEVPAIDLDLRRFFGRERCAAALQFKRQAFRKEVFDEELIDLLTPPAKVEQQLPTTGRRFCSQLQLVLIKAVGIGLPDKLAADLLIRAAYLHTDRLGLYRLAILVAQQAVEQHRLTRAIQVARAKDEELQRVCLRAGDVEFGQVQRCSVQA
ncbi:hypothetical protein D3C78_518480 [compost metagenome]